MLLPKDVENLINRLQSAGYEAYAVGGCVRDTLLGKTPCDWDICTSALPWETLQIFKDMRVIETGLKHGTVTVIVRHIPYEITTFRIDGEYLDSRRPENVSFVRDIKEDLSRRDFTVNAMAYNPQKGIVDLFCGQQDLQKGLIRAVGDAEKRFAEDALRIMRALRFAGVYDFEIEKTTAKALNKNAPLLRNIAKERIFAEFKKLLDSCGGEKILLSFPEVIQEILPEFNKNIYPLAVNKTFSVNGLKLRFAVFFSLLYKENAYSAVRTLKCDNETADFVKNLSHSYDIPLSPCLPLLRKSIFEKGWEVVWSIAKIRKNEDITKLLFQIKEENLPCSLKELAITGQDLKALDITGVFAGQVLKKLMYALMDEQVPNNKQALLSLAKTFKQ